MAATATQTANGTLVRNTSGSQRLFGFIGDRGKTMAVNEVALVPGDFPNQILSDHRRNRRDYDAALDALANGRVTILSKPTGQQLITVRVIDASAIAIGDLVWMDTADAKPAADFPWNTDLATTQGDFAAKFLGIAVDAHASGSGAGTIRVDTSPTRVWNMTVTSVALEIGKTFGPAKAAGNALLNQTLVASAAVASIARSTVYNAVAQTVAPLVFASALGTNSSNVNANIG